jgi:hypothetical protein
MCSNSCGELRLFQRPWVAIRQVVTQSARCHLKCLSRMLRFCTSSIRAVRSEQSRCNPIIQVRAVVIKAAWEWLCWESIFPYVEFIVIL